MADTSSIRHMMCHSEPNGLSQPSFNIAPRALYALAKQFRASASPLLAAVKHGEALGKLRDPCNGLCMKAIEDEMSPKEDGR